METPIHILACMPCFSRDSRVTVTPSAGSIRERCSLCDEPIWMGIKQQQYRREHPEMLVVCLVCVAVMNREQRDKVEVISLGGESAQLAIDGEPIIDCTTQEQADKADGWVRMPATKPRNLDRALKDKCSRCGCEVWYDPDMALKTTAPKICFDCARAELKQQSIAE